MTAMQKNFMKELTDKFFLRFHMSLILTLVVMTGFWSSKLLYLMGLENMTLRYSLSFLLSYASFFAFIKIWLWYVFTTRDNQETSWNLLDFDLWFLGSKKSGPSWGGKGGNFSGGGASSSFDKSSGVESKASGFMNFSSKGSSKASSFVPDLDEGAPFVVAFLIIACVFVLLGSALYFVFNAPMILGEIAFELALGIGILKSNTRTSHPFEWMNSAFKKTWLFALGLLILVMTTTLTIHYFKPEITKSSEVKTWLWEIKEDPSSLFKKDEASAQGL